MSGSASEQAATSAGLSRPVIPPLRFVQRRTQGGGFPSGPGCTSMGQYGHHSGGTGRKVLYNNTPCHPTQRHLPSAPRVGWQAPPAALRRLLESPRWQGSHGALTAADTGSDGAASHPGSWPSQPGACPWDADDAAWLQNCLTPGAVAGVHCPATSQGPMCSLPAKVMVKKVRAVLFKTGFTGT